jgi:GntR family transcriptional repressor for pyruvate dehydrogenase complex
LEAIFIPLKRKSRSTVVFEMLLGKIQAGFWKPGERIYTEAELTSAFNVGRSTVREALNLLKAGNLVYTVPGLGTFVNEVNKFADSIELDPENIHDVLQAMEFRVGYEPYCASLAAKRITDEEINKLLFYVKRQEANLLLDNDTKEFVEMDMSFHRLIAEATRNTLFTHSFELVREHLLKQQVISASYAERRSKAVQYHQQIIKAFTERNHKQAEMVMREHVSETKNSISALIKADTEQILILEKEVRSERNDN